MNWRGTNSSSPLRINECLLRSPEPDLAHSQGKPHVSPATTTINVRFATPFIMDVAIHVADPVPEDREFAALTVETEPFDLYF